MTERQWLGVGLVTVMTLGLGWMIRWITGASARRAGASSNEPGAGRYDTSSDVADQNPGHYH